MAPQEQDEQTPLSSSSASSKSGFNLTRCLGCFNLGAVSILTIAVVWIFLQLQVVTYKLTQATRHIDQVLDKVTNDQQAQIEDLNVKVDEEHDLTILHMAATFTLLSGLISMFHMTAHLRNMNEPFVQRKILAILWMPPIYAVTSFLSLVWPVMEGYLSIIKDFYEAYVIYTFLSFLIAVMGRGDRSVVVQRLALHADHLDTPTRCLSSCYHPPPEESAEAKAKAVLMECQILAMQFVFCRPLTSIATFVLMTLSQVETDDVAVGSNSSTDYTGSNGAEDTGSSGWAYFTSPLFYIAMIQNVSVFFAFSGMLKFYHAVRDDLQWCQPFSKFLVIKGVVFMTFWQGLVISIICNLHQGGRWEVTDSDGDTDPRQNAITLQNVLICLEMLFFSIAHWCVFPTEEWEEGYAPREYAKPGIGIKDFVSDMNLIVQSSKASRRSKKNTGDISEELMVDEEVGTEHDLSLATSPGDDVRVVSKHNSLD